MTAHSRQASKNLGLAPSRLALAVFKKKFECPMSGKMIRYDFFVFSDPKKDLTFQLAHSAHEFVFPWPNYLFVQNPDYAGVLGLIEYSLEWKTTAITYNYYPKGDIDRSNPAYSLRGVGNFVEYLCTADLMKNEGIKYIKTTKDPRIGRKTQLEKNGLQIFTRTDIREWLERLGGGIQKTSHKLFL